MNDENLNFDIRYAINVLELDASFWRKLSFALKMLSYLSATAAIASITAVSQPVAIFFACLFAVAQGIEFFAPPSDKAREATAMCDVYKRLPADLLTNPADEVRKALALARQNDSIKVFRVIKECAYNQTVKEQGLDETSCFEESWLHKTANFLL